MYMHLLANGKPAELMGLGAVHAARDHIATTLWKGQPPERMQSKNVHWAPPAVRSEADKPHQGLEASQTAET